MTFSEIKKERLESQAVVLRALDGAAQAGESMTGDGMMVGPEPTLGDGIRQARIAMGWSQTRLGDAVGVTRSQVRKWEKQDEIQVSQLHALVEVLRVPLSIMLGDMGDDLRAVEAQETVVGEKTRARVRKKLLLQKLHSCPVIYIAAPYSAETAWDVEQNIRRAEAFILPLVKQGAAPLCPHTMTRYHDGTMDYKTWLEVTATLLLRCDGMLVVGDYKKSGGTLAEIQLCEERGIPWATSIGVLLQKMKRKVFC